MQFYDLCSDYMLEWLLLVTTLLTKGSDIRMIEIFKHGTLWEGEFQNATPTVLILFQANFFLNVLCNNPHKSCFLEF